MKKIAAALFCVILLSSCSKHFIQIYEAGSSNAKLKEDSFVYENDTLRLTYSFWSDKGLVTFKVYNKLSKPIYIDWKNSAFIYNDHKLNYWLEESQSEEGVTSNVVSYNGPLGKIRTTMNEGVPTHSSAVVTNERVTFIPPKSYYDRSQFYLLPVNQCELSVDCPSIIVPRNDDSTKQTTVYGYDYSESNSPLKFRNYLAFSTSQGSKDFFFVDNGFYLASVKEMDMRHYKGAKKPSASTSTPANYEYPYKKNTSFYLNLQSYYYSVEIRK